MGIFHPGISTATFADHSADIGAGNNVDPRCRSTLPRFNTARRHAGAIDQANTVGGNALRARMGIKNARVTGRDKADAVVDDGLRRIGGGRNGAHHAPRSTFDDNEAVVIGIGFGAQNVSKGAFGATKKAILGGSAAQKRSFFDENRSFLGSV